MVLWPSKVKPFTRCRCRAPFCAPHWRDVAEVARHLEVSEQTYHRWRNRFGGMKADDAKRLRELEGENRELKRIMADKELETLALREIAKVSTPE